MKRFLSVCVFTLATAPAFAGDIYAGIGVPGLVLGYSQPVSSSVAIRGDVTTIGSRNYTYSTSGINYDGTLKANRLGLFADFFVSGGFRLTGGVTFNDANYETTGRGTGTTVNIGGTTYMVTAADSVIAKVKFPTTMPYVGIGYSTPPSGKPGWGFMFDAGISLGRPKVTGRVNGPSAGNVAQADVDRELDSVRGDLNKVGGIPQLTVGVSYRF